MHYTHFLTILATLFIARGRPHSASNENDSPAVILVRDDLPAPQSRGTGKHPVLVPFVPPYTDTDDFQHLEPDSSHQLHYSRDSPRSKPPAMRSIATQLVNPNTGGDDGALHGRGIFEQALHARVSAQ